MCYFSFDWHIIVDTNFLQRNAKQAAEKRYTDALHGCDLTDEFISSKAAKSGSARKASPSSDSKQR